MKKIFMMLAASFFICTTVYAAGLESESQVEFEQTIRSARLTISEI